MNFLPCRLERNGTGLRLSICEQLSFPVPDGRCDRYRSYVGKDLIFGLRPEHLTEPRGGGQEGCQFDATLDVVEPMGMETMVFFPVNGTEICGRVAPAAAKNAGESMRLYADLNHMHLIDPASDVVL